MSDHAATLSSQGEPAAVKSIGMGMAASKSAATKKAATKKAPTKKAPTKKAPTKKAATKKPATKKPATKKAATKKPATKKPATKKPATKKPATKKPATKKPATKKPATKKPATKKAPTKKAPTKKAPTKKAPTKKAPTKKAPAAPKPSVEPTPTPSVRQPVRERARPRNPALVAGLLELPPALRTARLEESTVEDLRQLIDASYPSELVNALMDLKRADVKGFFERLLEGRRRALMPVIALYEYRVYLTDPLPLQVRGPKSEWYTNYYALLGVSRDAWPDEIEEAYKLLARAFDEENFPPEEREIEQRRFEEITVAYQSLSTPERRKEADRVLPNFKTLYPRRESSWLEALKNIVDH